MLKLAVLVSGGGTNLQALIDAIENGQLKDVEITAVISNKVGVYALERAKNHGISSFVVDKREYETRDLFEEAFLDLLNSLEVDLIVLAGFLMILPEKMVGQYKNRIINIHPSLLPAFCGEGFYGLKVHEAALSRGVKVTGATVHFVDEGCDTGPIILQKPVMVEENDTPETLQKRVMEEAEWMILPKAIDLYARGRLRIENHTVRII